MDTLLGLIGFGLAFWLIASVGAIKPSAQSREERIRELDSLYAGEDSHFCGDRECEYRGLSKGDIERIEHAKYREEMMALSLESWKERSRET